MSIKKVLKIVLVASIVMLAIGFGTRVTTTARALPLAQASVSIPYSGSLTDEAEKPVADGTYGFTFALYEFESGGDALWNEAVEGVTVQDGSFTVLLGSVNPLPTTALEGGTRWLEIGVRGPGEAKYTILAPRQELSTTAPGVPAGPSAASACAHDHWNESWSGSGVGLTLTSSNDTALWGISYGGWAGVDGRNTSGKGLYGESSTGNGVVGKTTSTSTTGNVTGVWGEVSSSASYPSYARGVVGWATKTSGANYGVWGQSESSGGSGVVGKADSSGCSAGAFGTCSGVAGTSSKGNAIRGDTSTGYAVAGFASGNGIALFAEGQGTGNLIEAYHGPVSADREFYVDYDGDVYADGTYYGLGGVNAGSADFAEMMLPGQTDLEPGDVLAIDPNGHMVRSTTPYQATVVGVYSTEPGFVAGNKLDEDGNPLEPERIPLAVIGVVPVKVSAENGAIHPGDLLVASSTPGHAMKAGANPAVGTVIGKALGSVESGTGVIQMLVMLQ